MFNTKRILLNAMVKRDNLYWYEDIPFSGIGFETGQNDVVRGYEMEQGRIGRSYVPLCRHERNSDKTMEVDLSDNLADYEKQTYQGEPYTGIGYVFDEDEHYCQQEIFYRNGYQKAVATWNEDAFMQSFAMLIGIFGEQAEWHLNGQLKNTHISTGQYYSGSLAFTEDGKLRCISANQKFIDALPTIAIETLYFPIKAFSEIKQFHCAEETYISGNDIDDMLINDMAASGMFKETKKLELFYTSIKKQLFFYNESAPVLREIAIKNDDPVEISFAKYIKLDRPELRVLFNDVEVELPTISGSSDAATSLSTPVKLRGLT